MPGRHRFIAPLVLSALLALTGCQSSEEKAEDHFSSARELAEAGDIDRAIVELRNVFEFAPNHRDARVYLAELLSSKGDIAGAYGQYVLLVDQHPDALEGHIRVAELALTQNDWEVFAARTRDAQRLAPEDPQVRALVMASDYRAATETQNETARERLAADAERMRAELPENAALRRIAIDRLVSGPTPADALPLLDEALAVQPVDYVLQEMKLGLLIANGEADAVSDHLRRMIEVFPQSERLPATLLQWLLQQNDLDGAEAFLKERAGAPDGPIDNHVALVEFQKTLRSPDTAIATLDGLITANADKPNASLYGALRASIRFEQGQTDAAISEVEAILATATPSDEMRRIKTLFARMLDAKGDTARARTLIDEVLAEDSTQVEALLMRAAWRIADDRASDAIIDLRAALSQSPEDPRILSQIAAAYLRDGSRDLAADSLAQAVKVSTGAPEYALRYAAFLREEGRDTLAKTVLYDSWRSNPAEPALLEALSNLAVSTEDWTLATELAQTMRSFGTEAYASAADQLESAALIGQDRVEEGLALLETRAAAGPSDARWVSLVVQTQIRSGKTAEARAFLDDARARLPDDRDLRHQSAALHALQDENDAAIAEYRRLLAEDPADELAIRQLYSLLILSGETAEAQAILAKGLETIPTSVDLRWIKASYLQESGDFEGALAMYEALYAEDSSNVIVANNLASLLTTLHWDEATIARAYTIARRLRGTPVPAFQDTYGWIAHLKGETLESLPYLEAAAEGLPDDGSVQYHLGAAYAALGRADEARTHLSTAVVLAGEASPPWRIAADAALTALDQTPAPASQTGTSP